jgi:uncharacterized membrane protein
MEMKKSKYDTNPLDPDLERKSSENWGDRVGGEKTQPVHGVTSDLAGSDSDSSRQNVYSEAPTRRIDSPPLEAPYPSIFVPPPYAPPAQYQQPTNQVYQPPPVQSLLRPVSGLGVAERWAVMMAYAPGYVGLVVSLIELFLVPRKEAKVRFHASQALALNIAILIVHTLFGVISTITDSSLGGTLFKIAFNIFLIISMVRAWRGESVNIAPLAEPAQWFNEHIEPRNKG